MDNLANSINLDCIPAADEISIPRVEYDNFIALQARVETIKDYIQNDKYASIETVSALLGIDKTS